MGEKEVADTDIYQVTCLDTAAYMEPFLQDESRTFVQGEVRVRDAWTEYIKNGGSLVEPEKYMILK